DVGRLPAEIESCIWFCVREALTNALTHAGDVTPRLRLSRDAESVSFSVEDDGAGFDVETAPHDRGLQGIVERLATVGGTASIVSAPGRGTVVSGSVPVAAYAESMESSER
ncbi:MAG TPA: ATP-binding protein, partial [Gaiellaceae bacterium]|nr:ATP-binding protein [Gaiellaceae bacterium]